MGGWSDDLVQKTVRHLQPYQDAPLSEEAAREILDNLTALFTYLRELEQKYGVEENV